MSNLQAESQKEHAHMLIISLCLLMFASDCQPEEYQSASLMSDWTLLHVN